MIVTVCQLHGDGRAFERDWQELVRSAQAARSDLVLLPQMPFASSFLSKTEFARDQWEAAVDAHERAETKFGALQPAAVIGTRPVDFGNHRYEQGFVWSAGRGLRGVHTQTDADARPGAWEAHWYDNETPDFVPVQVGPATAGFFIGRELCNEDEALRYRLSDVDLLVAPRATCDDLQFWHKAARSAALRTGAYCLSSARVDNGIPESGAGYVVDPDGQLVAVTDAEHPALSVCLDLARSKAAKI